MGCPRMCACLVSVWLTGYIFTLGLYMTIAHVALCMLCLWGGGRASPQATPAPPHSCVVCRVVFVPSWGCGCVAGVLAVVEVCIPVGICRALCRLALSCIYLLSVWAVLCNSYVEGMSIPQPVVRVQRHASLPGRLLPCGWCTVNT